MDLITYEDKVALNENASIPNNNKVTANDMNMIKNVINSMWNQEYPIGRIVEFYDLNDHSDYLGFTWERCMVGNFPVGYDSSDSDFNSIGKTGGEKTHTLTVNEMPSHEHYGLYYNNENKTPIAMARSSGSTTTGYGLNYGTNVGIYSPSSIRVNAEGGGQAHNNVPPYEVIAYWRRTA